MQLLPGLYCQEMNQIEVKPADILKMLTHLKQPSFEDVDDITLKYRETFRKGSPFFLFLFLGREHPGCATFERIKKFPRCTSFLKTGAIAMLTTTDPFHLTSGPSKTTEPIICSHISNPIQSLSTVPPPPFF